MSHICVILSCMSTIDIQYCKNVCRDDHVKHIHSTNTPITISQGCTEQGGCDRGPKWCSPVKTVNINPFVAVAHLVIVSYLKNKNKKNTDIHIFDWCNLEDCEKIDHLDSMLEQSAQIMVLDNFNPAVNK